MERVYRNVCGEGDFSTIILAAGRGKRMNSELAKVLHPIMGLPMLAYTLRTARAVGSRKIVVVVGHQAQRVRAAFPDADLFFVEQREQLGTGHAVLQARDAFSGYEGSILILCGDVPLIMPQTLLSLGKVHRDKGAAVTVATALVDDPAGYGRVVLGADGEVLKIVEERDATGEEKEIRLINTGIYCVESGFLFDAVAELRNDNEQGEYYLTDIVFLARHRGLAVASFLVEDPRQVMGINTPEQLEEAARRLSEYRRLGLFGP